MQHLAAPRLSPPGKIHLISYLLSWPRRKEKGSGAAISRFIFRNRTSHQNSRLGEPNYSSSITEYRIPHTRTLKMADRFPSIEDFDAGGESMTTK